VVATRAGWVDQTEVVEVTFDPKVLARADLERRALAGCATRIFAAGTSIRAADDQKYYLKQRDFRFVPMSAAQAARVHASVSTGSAEGWLSPRQRDALRLIRAAPKAPWPDLVGVPLAEAWVRFRTVAGAALPEPAAATH
jgi:hypothetical protein